MLRKSLIITIGCMLAIPASAQMVNPATAGPDPAQAALGQEIMECVSGKVQFRARINQLETELAKLRASSVEEKKP